MGQEQELSMTDVVKWHTKEWCIKYFYSHYVDDFLEPQQMNNNCGETVHTEMVDRGFNVIVVFLERVFKVQLQDYIISSTSTL